MFVESVVIGNSVESMFYALKKQAFHITTPRLPLLFYKKLQVPLFGFTNEPGAYTRLCLIHGLCGKLLNFEKIQNIRVTEDIIKIHHGGGLCSVKFGSCEIFDPTCVIHENETVQAKQETYMVVDDFELRNLGRSVRKISPMMDGSGFVNQMHFYTSDRIDGANYVTDAATESVLTLDQLRDFDYSDTSVKFLIERHLHASGVFGTVAGRYKSGKVKYRKPIVKHVKRIMSKIDNNIYRDTERVRFVSESLKEIINE